MHSVLFSLKATLTNCKFVCESCAAQASRLLARMAQRQQQLHSSRHDDGDSLPMERIRNIGIVAHIDAGKTTTTERMLFYSGLTRIMGEVHDGDTVTDYMSQERERGITITSAAVTFPWLEHRINLVDTPGHVDFTVEVERCLRVLEGAITILDASTGVEAQTVTVWSQADRYGVPRVIYLNKMDKPTSDLQMCVESIKHKLGVRPLLVHLPVGRGKEFNGIVDLVSMEKLTWRNDQMRTDGKSYARRPLQPGSDGTLWEQAAKQRELLIGNLIEEDKGLAEMYLNSDMSELLTEDIRRALRTVTLNRTGFPVLCGSSYRNVGVQPLMDAVVHYLPHPSEREPEFVKYYGDSLCGLVFKIIHDKHKGAMTFLRVYSGRIKQGQKLYNVSKEANEKASGLMVAFANEFKDVASVGAGNIGVVTGLKRVVTGDTLTESSAAAKRAKGRFAELQGLGSADSEGVVPILAGIQVPEPVFFCTIEPESLAYQKQLDMALECLQREDPSFRVEVDSQSGQVIMSGMGELHIDVLKDRLAKEYGVRAYLGELQIAYKESIREKCSNTVELDKVLGGTRHRVKVTVALAPCDNAWKGASGGNRVRVIPTSENQLGKLRTDHMKALENGVQFALSHGVILGFPVVNVSVLLLWLEVGPGTSATMITSAASQCVAGALRKSRSMLLEPIMALEVTVGDDYLGNVLTDLSTRRSEIKEVKVRDRFRVVTASTPLAELIGYVTDLRTLTSGSATFTMEFQNYMPMNMQEQNNAIARITGFSQQS